MTEYAANDLRAIANMSKEERDAVTARFVAKMRERREAKPPVRTFRKDRFANSNWGRGW